MKTSVYIQIHSFMKLFSTASLVSVDGLAIYLLSTSILFLSGVKLLEYYATFQTCINSLYTLKIRDHKISPDGSCQNKSLVARDWQYKTVRSLCNILGITEHFKISWHSLHIDLENGISRAHWNTAADLLWLAYLDCRFKETAGWGSAQR